MHPWTLIAPAFIAGILMFFAPCTLPMVPAFLGFLGGAHGKGASKRVRAKVMQNALLYVIGFSSVFVLLGTIFGVGGSAIATHRHLLTRIGGVFIVIFGLSMLGVLNIKALQRERRFHPGRLLKPGNPLSAFIFGATFALGWSPCIGPILGSILLLASSSATAWSGALLLSVFSLGLALPFLVLAAGYGHAAEHVKRLNRLLPVISMIGGVFLIVIGLLMAFNRLDVWLGYAYGLLEGTFAYDALLDRI